MIDKPNSNRCSQALADLLESVLPNPWAWLHSRNRHFGNRRPIDLVGTDEEQKVIDLLRAADQGLR